MLTYQALKNGSITVLEGIKQDLMFIKDMTNIYCHFLNNTNIPSGCYNSGFENISILDIAKKVQNILKLKS